MLLLTLNEVQPGSVDLAIDEEGLARLIEALSQLRDKGCHIHLRGPRAGGDDLDGSSPWGHEHVLDELVLTWAGDIASS